MKAKNALVGLGMLAVLFGAASGAQAAVPLDRYMAAPDKVEQASPGNPSKGHIIAAVYKAYANHYFSKKETAHIGECMERTYKTKTPDGGSRLDGLVNYNLKQTAQRSDASEFTVESVVESVIKAECGGSGTAKADPARPGGPG